MYALAVSGLVDICDDIASVHGSNGALPPPDRAIVRSLVQILLFQDEEAECGANITQ